jgi:peptidyl-tRNA hydrolase, PTH1 family
MKLIVGLGNPGDKYKATRHNAGFWLVERLAAQSGTMLRKDGKFQALVGRHEASGAWLVLPQSYMNASGRPVQMMASFFKIAPADMLIVHDELDLPPGTARLKQGGGVAGHNGLKDISGRLGSHDYWRLRLGIGRPADKGAAIDFVLHRPPQDERAAIDEAIARALELLPLVLSGDLQGAMLKLHTQDPEDKTGRAKPAPRPAPPPEQLEAVQGERESEKVEKLVTAEMAGQRRAVAADPGGQTDKASSIEEFGGSAESGKPAAAERTGHAETVWSQQAERSEPAQAPAQVGQTNEPAAGKKSGLNSLLKKFLPGTDPARKK